MKGFDKHRGAEEEECIPGGEAPISSETERNPRLKPWVTSEAKATAEADSSASLRNDNQEGNGNSNGSKGNDDGNSKGNDNSNSNSNSKGNSNSNSRRRFPSGMTERKAKATARATATAMTKEAATRNTAWVFLGLGVLLVLVVVGSVGLGAVRVPIWGVLAGRGLSEMDRVIMMEIRLPRVLASAVVGGALATAGLLFQGLFRNPMADPYVIGSSGGAVAGAAVGILFFSDVTWLGFSGTAMLAFAGSLGTMAVVYLLARGRGATNVVTLLLAGFAVSTMLGSSTYLLEAIDPNPATGARAIAAWLRGAVSTPGWSEVGVAVGLMAVGLLGAWPLMRRLNTLALGEEYAEQLGVGVERTRLGILMVGSLLTAVAVSLGGLIGFAGLIVPHGARIVMGPDHVRLLPVTALAGAIFLVVADTLARTVLAPKEVPVGVLMALAGGPFFLYLLRTSRREYGL